MHAAEAGRARVRVPASTSNLGSGFDCVGFAVDRWLTASVAVGDVLPEGDAAVVIRRGGTLAGMELPAADDLLHAGFVAACRAAGRAVPGRVAYEAESEIAVSRGLGSSAAAFVAGALLASEALGLGLGRVRVADLCAAWEGHPDNAGPAALGGALLGVRAGGDGGYHYARLAVHGSLAFVFAVPDFELTTAAARAVLPATLPYAAAVTAAGKAAALVQGLAQGDAALLAAALDDVLHVPYRRGLIPGFAAVEEAALRAGAFGATLSGAGPTLLAIAPRPSAGSVAEAMGEAWGAHGVAAEVFVVEEPVPAFGERSPVDLSAAGA